MLETESTDARHAFYGAHQTDNPALDERLQIVLQLVAQFPPASLLDIACGRGTLLRGLRERYPACELYGIELSLESVAQANAEGLHVLAADVEKGLPLPDEAVDTVIFGEIIEHLIDPDAALLHISRVLRKGGKLIVTTPNLASWMNRILLLVGLQPLFTETSLHAKLGRRFRSLGQWSSTQGHLKVFTRGALEEMLQANGFTVEKVIGAPFCDPHPARALDKVISRFPSLASGIVVLAGNRRTLQTAYPT
jgi:methionine biosynthesis protein MetW